MKQGPSWFSSSITNGVGGTSLTLDDVKAAVGKIRGFPPARWLVMAPDGRVWASEDPAELVRVLCLADPGGIVRGLLREPTKEAKA